MKLFNYWRSSTAYRVRIALEMKGLNYERVAVNLARNGGENLAAQYLAVNPHGRIPSLMLDDGRVLIQSPAILEYLEECHQQPPLLPVAPEDRATVRAICAIIGCDIHPLNNVSILRVLRAAGHDEDFVQAWIRRWIEENFRVIEGMVGDRGFCFGDAPTLADVYLIPQVYNARRFDTPMEAFPKICKIEQNCCSLPAFAKASPEQQPDAVIHGAN
ncbi:Maleylacetoacetate isomerase [Paraburkholderia ribeironis]|uniref:Maleylacetoacetate isomerase n=1 Tax=Paraburkholderia ribeironis TaxID=1247936 RepID=A0A1N7RZP0_9BURK|nr:maleylacetoacetate isomerase [Paraburkholderia ribeironis]SIT40585.1 Maleylacetoacetate isomerase [Paraburkholderia ribeironis]